MKKWWMFLLSFALVAVLAACGGNQADPEPEPETLPEEEVPGDETPGADETPDATEGDEESASEGSIDVALAEEKYKQGCLMCHGHDLAGGTAPPLTEVGAKYTAEEIEDIIRNGIGSMPANMLQDDADIELVAAWLAEQK